MPKKTLYCSFYFVNKMKKTTNRVFKQIALASLITFVISCGKDDNLPPQNAVPVIEVQSFNASESITNTETIGAVKATDANSSDKLTFIITTNDNGLFEITNDGKLSLASGKILDFEITTSHVITVKVTDGKAEASAQITINVVDVNENTAPVIADQSFDIAENNATNAIMGQIVATDAEGDTLTYSLTTQSSEFSVDANGELKVLTALDYETTTSYTLEVSVSDGTLSSTATITINVTDVDESNADAFITTWKTTTANEEIIIHVRVNEPAFTYDYTINWGDGTIDTGISGNATHTYATAGTYQVAITETFPAISFFASSQENRNKLQSIDQWGGITWQSMRYAFRNCINVKELATDAPDLSNATDMTAMFQGAKSLNQDISNWKVDNIRDMTAMFANATAFNQDISNWKVDNVMNMSDMFNRATAFNQNIGNWKVYNVINMKAMFSFASAFNQNISNWKVGNVTNMEHLFNGASTFNQDISNWNVSNVENMESMFNNASVFNQDITGWKVSKVTNMSFMFQSAKAFNQPLNDWNVSNVTNMHSMFNGATAFNQLLNKWTISNVTNMSLMFADATVFNQDVTGWNVSNVSNMTGMFFGDSAFNQDISGWNVSNVTNMQSMFANNSAFNQDLTGWDVANVTNCSAFNQNAALSNSNRPNFTNCTP